jgi:hypothetical protein
VSNAAARAGKHGPVTGLKSGFSERGVYGAAGAHYGASGEVVDAVGDTACVAGGTEDVSDGGGNPNVSILLSRLFDNVLSKILGKKEE